MSDFCVYLKMPSYLRQWFIHRHGGSHPVELIRDSIESKLLQRATVPHLRVQAKQIECATRNAGANGRTDQGTYVPDRNDYLFRHFSL